jgi:uncharacterized RDD family membrane protein YckC
MAQVVSGEAVVLDVPCARFPSRMVALLIDMLVQVVLSVGLLIAIGAASAHLNADSAEALLIAGEVLVLVGYPVIFETLSRGKSLGKLALGLRVVSDDGGPERFRQAFVRGLASLVEIWALTGAPALISSMVSAQGKRLGDLFAGTFVIQERLPHRMALPNQFAYVPPMLLGWAQALEISRLDDHTAEQAASYLRRVWELTPVAREEFGMRIASEVAARVTPPPPPGTPPWAFLAAVLAVRRERSMARLAMHQAVAAPGQPPAPYPPAPYPGPQYPAAQYPAAQYPATQPVAQPPAAPAPPATASTTPLPTPAVTGQQAPDPEPPATGGFAPPQ